MSMIAVFKQITPEQLNELIANPDLVEELIFNEEEDDDSIDIDKAWHGIHFLLNNDPWDGEEPLKFTILGKYEIGEDVGYGPAHYLTSEDVKTITKALSNISAEALKSKFDADKMIKADIYPSVWEEEDVVEYLIEYYKVLVDYYNDAAEKGNAMLMSLT
jgi:hypothetical protein